MLEWVSLWHLLSGLAPVVSGLFWIAVMVFSVADSGTHLEKRVKVILMAYFCASTFNWGSMLVYTYIPEWFPYINPFTYFSFLVSAVLFFHFAYSLTESPGKKFPPWHYVLPALIGGTLLVWSFFVPFEVQVHLTTGRGAIVSDYPAYSRFFLSKPVSVLLFHTTYSAMAFIRLIRYYTYIGRVDTQLRPPAGWVIALISLTVGTMALTIIINIHDRATIMFTGIYMATSVGTALLQFVLGYNIIRRNFLLYMPLPLSAGLPVAQPEDAAQPSKRTYTRRTPMIQTDGEQTGYRKLTRKDFEEYMNTYTPWLNPQLKMGDLLEPLGTNRTILSGFINKTYGMNFNRYINRLRLMELERLRNAAGNAPENGLEWIVKAGFSTRRTYQRAVEAEREAKPKPVARKTGRNNQ